MCDTTVVIGSDGVMFAKNSDRDANEPQLVEWHGPTARAEPSAVTMCTSIAVPAEASAAVVLSRPWWMWGAEMGANEHGVVIGNEAVFTDQPYEEDGLLGMDLLRLALERSRSADDAVHQLVTLLERHGQGGAGSKLRPDFIYHNAYIVADPTTAIVVETAGRLWATEVVPAGTARSISNGLTIAGFADAHADRRRGQRNACAVRRAITEAGAATATGPAGLMATLRSHGTGQHPHYARVSGGMQAPCVHAGGAEKGVDTTASWVADLRGAAPLHWVTATAAPCTSIFKPVRVDEPVDLGPADIDRYDPDVMWWRHEQLHRLADRDPATVLGTFAAERDELERAWLADPPRSGDAFDRAAAAEAEWLRRAVAVAPRDRRPKFVRDARRSIDEAAGLPS